jgi:hypothetical protein
MCFSAYILITFLPCYYYLALSFYSCTCWVPTISVLNLAIFHLLSKPAAQKVKMDMKKFFNKESRLALPWFLFLWCFGAFHCSALRENWLCPWRHYLYNNYTFFMTFGYLWTLYVCVCGINDHGHRSDEYLILFTKSGMTEVVIRAVSTIVMLV